MNSPIQRNHQDATALAQAIKSGRMTARQAMQASLDAAAVFQSLGAITYQDAELGYANADHFDKAAEKLPFAGMPSLFKDLGGPSRDLPIRLGSSAFASASPTLDSELSARMRGAGLNFFGTTTVPEFGLALASEPAAGPIARHPFNDALSPGGSSGGAAAAVAAGIVAIAHATDAGGSIRVPAAACGLIGLKPSRGTMPGGPHFGNYLAGIANEFAVCRSVRDAESLLPLVTGRAESFLPDTSLSAAEPTSGLRIGLVEGHLPDYPVSAERLAAVEAAALFLESRGHRIVRIAAERLAPLCNASALAFDRIISANLAAAIDGLAIDESKLEPLTRAVGARGRAMSAVALYDAMHGSVTATHEFWQLFHDIDILLTPMLARAALPLGSFAMDHADVDAHWQKMSRYAPFASLANITGFPALTLPFGEDADGMPVPVQLMAPIGADYRLLQLAGILEADQRWQHKFPIAGLV